MDNLKKYYFNFLILLLPPITVGGLLVLSGDSADGLKLGFLSAFGCYLIFLACQKTLKNKKLFIFLSVCWWFIFLMHSFVLSMSWLLYGSNMDAYFILQSIANTSINEMKEFIQQHLLTLMVIGIFFVILFILYFLLLAKFFSVQHIQSIKNKKMQILMLFCGGLTLVAWSIRPVRAVSPPIYWKVYYQKVEQFRAQLVEHKKWQQNWLNKANQQIGYTDNFSKNQTIVLVLSESLSSYHLGVCGYPRNTTPEIKARLGELMVLCDAYSPYPSTLVALQSMLTDTPPDNHAFVPTESLLAYAKAAGFHVSWLSNQDDTYLSSLFGSFADEAIYNNKRSGRSSSAKDEELLGYFHKALENKAPRKLIILHMIGSHPNYSARYPKSFERFPNQEAAEKIIKKQLDDKNIGMWVREQRDDYDNSVAYQDWVFSELLTILKQDNTPSRSLVFISDHGNEVGREKDFAGHSPNTQAGYRIPIIMWDSKGRFPVGVNADKTFDGSLLDQNMMHIMGLYNKEQGQIVSWLDKDYHFKAPSNYPYWKQK